MNIEAGNSPVISVVIPALNEGRQIARCLEALHKQSLDCRQYEIIVVDDGSDDDTADVAARMGARAIRQQNKGPAAARNRGVDEARGEIILFIDADCIPDEHWVERMSSPLLAGAAEGTVGKIFSRQTHWVAALIQSELDDRYRRMGNHERVDLLNSGNCGFRRTLLCCNRFDERFRWIEDAELSFRLARDGHAMIFLEDALVGHSHPESLVAYMRRKFRYASFAPSVLRLYPRKTLSDSRSSIIRRLQLLLVALAVVSAPAAMISAGIAIFSLACLGSAIACSFRVYLRAASKSVSLGFAAPLFILMGNVAFASGIVWGTLAPPRFRPQRSAKVRGGR